MHTKKEVKKQEDAEKKFESDFEKFKKAIKEGKLDRSDEIEMRSSLRDTRDELRESASKIKLPELDEECAMVGNFKVKVDDVSSLASLVEQIKM